MFSVSGEYCLFIYTFVYLTAVRLCQLTQQFQLHFHKFEGNYSEKKKQKQSCWCILANCARKYFIYLSKLRAAVVT